VTRDESKQPQDRHADDAAAEGHVSSGPGAQDPRSPDLGPEARVGREAWVLELGEASVLASDDPARVAIEARVAERGGWSAAHWSDLLKEGQAWRRLLKDAEPPEELAARLSPIPRQHLPQADTLGRRRRRPLLWACAAVLLVAVGALAVRFGGRSTSPDAPVDWSEAISEVARLAIKDHLVTHEQDVLADDPATLARELASHIPFPVDLPDIGADMVPVGGRRCTLGVHPVAFTAWRGPAGRVTLLQMRRADFNLPADMAVQVVRPDLVAAEGRPLEVLFFGRADTVWVVVADDADDLRRVRQAVAKL